LQAKTGGCTFWASDDPVGFGKRLDNFLALGIF